MVPGTISRSSSSTLFFTRGREGITDLTGLVSHSDAGSVYTSVGIDAYGSALAETTVGSFKNELIWREGPWRGVEHVEVETLNWVDWFNERPHEYLGDSPSQGSVRPRGTDSGPGGKLRGPVRRPRCRCSAGTSAHPAGRHEG